MHISVSWFFTFCIFNKNQAYVCSFILKSKKKIFFFILGPSAFSAKVMTFDVMHYIREFFPQYKVYGNLRTQKFA
jgi:hypothetical protein